MKFKEITLNSIVFVSLVGLVLFFYETKYDEVDIESVLESERLSLKSNQALVVFSSKNPFNFYDIFSNYDDISSQDVYGVLTYPEVEREKYPVVVGVAGSMGWRDHHYEKMQMYLDMGIATLALRSFGSRGVDSTVGEQISVTIPMVIHDSFMALEALSKIDNIDIERVGITGWSLGGGVALFTAWKPIKDVVSPNFSFAAHLPFYPPCFIKPDNPTFTQAPVHILIGDDDDWVPAKPCVELVDEVSLFADNMEITTFPDAHHSFDRASTDIRLVPKAYSLTDCELAISSSGVVRTKDLSFPLNNSTLQKIALFSCAERGAHVGGNVNAKAESTEIAKAFFTRHLLN